MSLAPSSGQRVPVRTVVGGGRDTHDGHENSPILGFFSNLLGNRGLIDRDSIDHNPKVTRVIDLEHLSGVPCARQ